MSEVKNGRYESKRGDVRWYLNGKLHRENGPAIERSDGLRQWFQHGTLHREDGPAVEIEGSKEWWLNDEKLTEEEFKHWIEKKTLNESLQSDLLCRDSKSVKVKV